MGSLRIASLAAAISFAVAVPVMAQAPKADAARAAELKKKGDELVHASKYEEGLKLYDESYALVADPAVLYNRGRALQQLGRHVEALEALEKFSQTAPADLKKKVPNLEKMIDEIGQNIATLVIQCSVEGATVTVGGKTYGTTPLASPIRINQGEASIEVTADGYKPYKRSLSVGGGATTNVDATLEKIEEAASSPPPPPKVDTGPEPPPVAHAGSSGWKTFAFVSGGVGLASVGAGMVFFGLALSDKGTVNGHCPGKVCDATGAKALDEGQTFATVSTVLVVLGGVGLAGALAGFILAPRSRPAESAAVAPARSVRLVVGPGSLGIGGSF